MGPPGAGGAAGGTVSRLPHSEHIWLQLSRAGALLGSLAADAASPLLPQAARLNRLGTAAGEVHGHSWQ